MSTHLHVDSLQQCFETAQSRCRGEHPILASYSQPWVTTDQLRLFSANRDQLETACLWHVPSQDEYRLALGQAYEFIGKPGQAWASLQNRWLEMSASAVVEGDEHPALFGGFAFDCQKIRTRLWRDFPDAVLTLPRFELRQNNNSVRLLINALITRNSDCRKLAARLSDEWTIALSRPIPQPRPMRMPYIRQPLPHLWKQDVRNAVRSLSHAPLDKVVLARARVLYVREPVHCLLERLRQSQKDAYLFAFVRKESCFLGATPERLLRVKQGSFRTMALAGTAPRAENPDKDRQLGAQLLASAKDNNEHHMVVASLRQQLAPHCSLLRVAPQPQLHVLPQVQHLLTPIQGRLKPATCLLDLLETLHPTPAVGGLPRQAAMQYIRQCEQLDRGWYAAPIGWLDSRGDGEFAVALRCALLNADHAHLFAGCGLVKGSEAESEYRESTLKMRTMEEALTAGHTSLKDTAAEASSC